LALPPRFFDQALHTVGLLALAQDLAQLIELRLGQAFKAGHQLLVLGLFYVDFPKKIEQIKICTRFRRTQPWAGEKNCCRREVS